MRVHEKMASSGEGSPAINYCFLDLYLWEVCIYWIWPCCQRVL